MSLRGYYQNGYVTNDLDRAIALIGPDFGVGEFSPFDVDLVLQTPVGEKSASMRVATAWAGRLQLELIQPLSGHVDIYRNALPADMSDAVSCFHHVAVRRDDLDQMRSEVAALALPVAFETSGNGITSILVDARQRIGHHLEFVCATPAGWEILGWPSDP